jgi:hypothetical protein
MAQKKVDHTADEVENESPCRPELREEIPRVQAFYERIFKFPSQGQPYWLCTDGGCAESLNGAEINTCAELRNREEPQVV